MEKMTDVPENLRRKLIHEMKAGVFADCKRLPRETALSEMLGISRTQLRDVLSSLEQEGYITRKIGVGTIINHHVFKVKNRMDIETEFLDIIRNNGYEAGMECVTATEEKADVEIAQKLQLPEGTVIMRVTRICTANGKPALYCEDVFAKEFIQREYTLRDLEPPIFVFLKKFCDKEAYMDLTQIHAAIADARLAAVLQIEEGVPIMNMEETDYDLEGNVIFCSKQYFIDELFEQTVMRKKL